MADTFCSTPFLKLRDVPCCCAPPPFQCSVEDTLDLPACPDPVCPDDPSVPIENGDVIIVLNPFPIAYFFWDCNWYALANFGLGDKDWFVVGVGGPDYGAGLNTDPAYHEGQVAINRTSIRGTSGVLDIEGQIMADGAFTGVSDVPVSGAGCRFMWLPETGSIRAGCTAGTEWNDGNIGNYSVAFNNENIASGESSFATGAGNISSGRYSFTNGGGNLASADHSVAIGQGGESTSDDSFTGGAFCKATAPRSWASGTTCESNGIRAWTHGKESKAEAEGSFTVGERVELSATAQTSNLFGQARGLPIEIYTQENSFITHGLRPFLSAPNSAPVDADIHNGQISFWINQTTNDLVFRVKYSTGILKTGSISLV